MSSFGLLWVGGAERTANALLPHFEAELSDVTVTSVPNGREALAALALHPTRHLIAVIDAPAAEMDLGTLVTSIKQVNPAIEMVVFGETESSWSTLNLPRNYRPILLAESCSHDALVSCIAKLKEMVEAKEDYTQLSRRIRNTIAVSRAGTESLLSLLSRQNSVGMIAIRRDGFFSTSNAEAERLTGYSSDEVAHIQVWLQTLLLDYESVRFHLAEIERYWIEKTGRENIKLRIKRKDGRVIELSMVALVLPDELGQPRQIVALFFDPMESRRAVEYDALLNSDACGLYTYQPGVGFLRISVAALELLNRAFRLDLTADRLFHHQITDLPIPRDIAGRWQELLDGLASGRVAAKESLFPVGLPGRRIMDHTFAARVSAGEGERPAVLALVVPKEELKADTFKGASLNRLAKETLYEIPRPCLLLRAVRDQEGRITDFLCVGNNPAGSDLLDVPDISGLGIPFGEIIADAIAREEIVERAKEVTETGKPTQFESWLTVNSGKHDNLLVDFWLGKAGDGIALFLRDVTAKREEEHQLNQYRHVFSHMQEATIVTDLEGNVIDWNPASERMFGYKKEEMLGQSVFRLTRTLQGEELDQSDRDVFQEGDLWTGEYEFVRADGGVGVVYTVFGLLKDDQGIPYGSVGLCHDRTERKRLDERLNAKSQELQEKNLALNTLLRHAEAERLRACEQMALDVTRRVAERVQKILESPGEPAIVESQALMLLQDLGGASESRQTDREDPRSKLSEKELEVARLVRLGKKSDEIAFILAKSLDTIRLQRISIRKKLGLTRRDSNLAGYLKQFDLS
jgi:PAS domain S-box-containing protein